MSNRNAWSPRFRLGGGSSGWERARNPFKFLTLRPVSHNSHEVYQFFFELLVTFRTIWQKKNRRTRVRLPGETAEGETPLGEYSGHYGLIVVTKL